MEPPVAAPAGAGGSADDGQPGEGGQWGQGNRQGRSDTGTHGHGRGVATKISSIYS